MNILSFIHSRIIKCPSVFFLFLSLLVSWTNLYGQKYEIIDNATIRYTYKYSILQDKDNPADVVDVDMYLLVGSNYAYYTSLRGYKKDSVINSMNLDFETHYNSETFHMMRSSYEGFSSSSLVKLNVYSSLYNLRETTSVGHIAGLGRLEIKDTTELKWDITNKDTIINNYRCIEAKTEFAGRKYCAFFCIDLPAKCGPYKFHGLPGAIIEIWDTRKEHKISLISVESLNPKVPILQNKEKKFNFTMPKYIKALSLRREELADKIAAMRLEDDHRDEAIRKALNRSNFIEIYE